MQVAVRHPGMVNRLIVASSFYRREGLRPGFFEGLEKASLENMPPALKTAYLDVVPDKGRLAIMFERDRARMMGFRDWSDSDLKSITAPARSLFREMLMWFFRNMRWP